ncbi:hypothetical protein ACOMHN_041648 [Nucella lapillus]
MASTKTLSLKLPNIFFNGFFKPSAVITVLLLQLLLARASQASAILFLSSPASARIPEETFSGRSGARSPVLDKTAFSGSSVASSPALDRISKTTSTFTASFATSGTIFDRSSTTVLPPRPQSEVTGFVKSSGVVSPSLSTPSSTEQSTREDLLPASDSRTPRSSLFSPPSAPRSGKAVVRLQVNFTSAAPSRVISIVGRYGMERAECRSLNESLKQLGGMQGQPCCKEHHVTIPVLHCDTDPEVEQPSTCALSLQQISQSCVCTRGSSLEASQIVSGAFVSLTGKGKAYGTYSRSPRVIDKGDTGDEACDSYHRHKEDVRLLKSLGVSHYRFSISWPRLLPEGTPAKVNQPGLRYYHQLIDELLAAGIQPMVTLYHWDLPDALEQLGGWLYPQVSDWFRDYADLCFKEFGSKVSVYFG